ncbi:hypothetical protein ACLIMP_00795 [Novosphingobium aerophilum]|uniref:hypothetical protein n=1 Tax=Novosphingobium TaxID=165696 RepID=UPI002D78C53A|nr:hypothetical protein [Novosphingobium sp. RL4]WRT92853.1 hypothetical protein U9J33_16935 [Novosphingobium sp. RL4]
MTFFRNATITAALAATALAGATPAMARDYHRGNDNTAAVAIGAGVIGLALGAIIASNSNDHDRDRDRYYDSSYAYTPSYGSGWEYRDGWYWDRDGGRHSRDDYYRNQRGDYRRGYDHDRGDYRRGY